MSRIRLRDPKYNKTNSLADQWLLAWVGPVAWSKCGVAETWCAFIGLAAASI
jgi:hypothetical protein